jgi:hypothetical protein
MLILNVLSHFKPTLMKKDANSNRSDTKRVAGEKLKSLKELKGAVKMFFFNWRLIS